MTDRILLEIFYLVKVKFYVTVSQKINLLLYEHPTLEFEKFRLLEYSLVPKLYESTSGWTANGKLI